MLLLKKLDRKLTKRECVTYGQAVYFSPIYLKNFHQLARVHCTFANIPIGLLPIGESPLHFRQYTLMTFANWRESTVLSPIYLRTFAIGESLIGENLIGKIRESRFSLRSPTGQMLMEDILDKNYIFRGSFLR